MNILDLLLSIFLVLGLVQGLARGFFSELAGLLALLGGVYAAVHFSGAAYVFLNSFIDWNEKYLIIFSFALTFFVVALLISLAGNVLTKMVNIIALGIFNRLAGGILGVLKMAFLASLFLMFATRFQVFNPDEATKETSKLYPHIAWLAPAFLPGIIEEIREGDLFDTEPEELNESSQDRRKISF